MKDCNHIKSGPGTLKGLYLEETFETAGIVCLDCGAELWTSKERADFEKFKKGVSTRHKDRMKIQKIRLTTASNDYIEKISHDFDVDKSKVIRSILALYFTVIKKQKIGLDLFQKVKISAEMPQEIKGVRLGKRLFDQVRISSEIMHTDMNEYVCQVVNRVIFVITTGKNLNKKQKEILGDGLDGMLQAAS